MLCSECGKKIRPVVALDIDGTLGDYHTHFSHFAWQYWDRPWRRDLYDGLGEFEDWLGLTKEEYRQAKLAYRQGGMKRTMPVYDDAARFFYWVRQLGVEIWVATTRPFQRLDNIDPDTREWLRRCGFKIDGLLYGEDKYNQLLQAVDERRVIGVVDDLMEQLLIAQGLGLQTWQVARPHNTRTTLNLVNRGTLVGASTWLADNRKEWSDTYERRDLTGATDSGQGVLPTHTETHGQS